MSEARDPEIATGVGEDRQDGESQFPEPTPKFAWMKSRSSAAFAPVKRTSSKLFSHLTAFPTSTIDHIRSNNAPLPQRLLHTVQLTLSLFSIPVLFLYIVLPALHDWFRVLVFLPWLLSSIANLHILATERKAGRDGKLDKSRWFELQMGKFVCALIAYIFCACLIPAVGHSGRVRERMDRGLGLWWTIVSAHSLNWFLVWTSLFVGCVTPKDSFQGQIRLTNDRPLALNTGDIPLNRDGAPISDDEAFARALQAQEPGWQA